MVALPAPAPKITYFDKGLALAQEIGKGLIIGAALWYVAFVLYYGGTPAFEAYAKSDGVAFDVFPYAVIGVGFILIVGMVEKPLLRLIAKGLFYGSLSVLFLASLIEQAHNHSSFPYIMLCIELALPSGLVVALIEHVIRRCGAAFCKSLGFWTWWDFGQWAASVLTISLLVGIALGEPLGKIGIEIIAAFIIGSAVKEWFDYRRTGQKSADWIQSIIVLKIGGFFAALVAILLLLIEHKWQMPLAKIVYIDMPLVAATFCALAIPSFLMAYKDAERQPFLDCCRSASAFWGIGAVTGFIAVFIWALIYHHEDERFNFEPMAGTIAIWAGFACALAVLLPRVEIRVLLNGFITGTYTAIEIAIATFGTLLAFIIYGFFAWAIIASVRPDLHVFHPITWEDRMYLGILIGLGFTLLFIAAKYAATVLNLLQGPLRRPAAPPERSPF